MLSSIPPRFTPSWMLFHGSLNKKLIFNVFVIKNGDIEIRSADFVASFAPRAKKFKLWNMFHRRQEASEFSQLWRLRLKRLWNWKSSRVLSWKIKKAIRRVKSFACFGFSEQLAGFLGRTSGYDSWWAWWNGIMNLPNFLGTFFWVWYGLWANVIEQLWSRDTGLQQAPKNLS